MDTSADRVNLEIFLGTVISVDASGHVFVDVGDHEVFLDVNRATAATLDPGRPTIVQTTRRHTPPKRDKATSSIEIVSEDIVIVIDGTKSVRKWFSPPVELRTSKRIEADRAAELHRITGSRIEELDTLTAPITVIFRTSAARLGEKDVIARIDAGIATVERLLADARAMSGPGLLRDEADTDADVDVSEHEGEWPLPSGGRITIERTRAFWAVDVDTATAGAARAARDATNAEAIDRVTELIISGDLCGLMVIDLAGSDPGSTRDLAERLRSDLLATHEPTAVHEIADIGVIAVTRRCSWPKLVFDAPPASW